MTTDDIVTRLRGQACPECGLPSTHNQFDEAADEIERLRSKEQTWRLTCSKLVYMMLPFSLLMKPQEQEELKIILQEAVRGEW